MEPARDGATPPPRVASPLSSLNNSRPLSLSASWGSRRSQRIKTGIQMTKTRAAVEVEGPAIVSPFGEALRKAHPEQFSFTFESPIGVSFGAQPNDAPSVPPEDNEEDEEADSPSSESDSDSESYSPAQSPSASSPVSPLSRTSLPRTRQSTPPPQQPSASTESPVPEPIRVPEASFTFAPPPRTAFGPAPDDSGDDALATALKRLFASEIDEAAFEDEPGIESFRFAAPAGSDEWTSADLSSWDQPTPERQAATSSSAAVEAVFATPTKDVASHCPAPDALEKGKASLERGELTVAISQFEDACLREDTRDDAADLLDTVSALDNLIASSREAIASKDFRKARNWLTAASWASKDHPGVESLLARLKLDIEKGEAALRATKQWETCRKDFNRGRWAEVTETCPTLLANEALPIELRLEMLELMGQAQLAGGNATAAFQTAMDTLQRHDGEDLAALRLRLEARTLLVRDQLGSDLSALQNVGRRLPPAQQPTWLDGTNRTQRVLQALDDVAFESQLESAKFDADAGNYEAALARYSALLNHESVPAKFAGPAHVGKAECLFQQKAYTICIQACDSALEAAGQEVKARLFRGRAHKALRQYDKAMDDFDSVSWAGAQHPLASVARAELATAKSEFEKTQLAMSEATAASGRIFAQNGNPQMALTTFDHALTKINHARIYGHQNIKQARSKIGLERARTLLDLGQFAAAAASCQTIDRLRENIAEVIDVRARALQRMGKHSKAFSEINKALDAGSRPKVADPKDRERLSALREEIRTEAERTITETMERHELEGKVAMDQGRYKDAETAFLAAKDATTSRFSTAPQDVVHGLMESLALAQVKAGNGMTGRTTAESVLKERPRSIRALRAKGLAEIALGDILDARTTLVKAKGLCGSDHALAEVLEEDVNRVNKQADAVLVRTLQDAIRSGDGAYRLSRYDEALRHFSTAVPKAEVLLDTKSKQDLLCKLHARRAAALVRMLNSSSAIAACGQVLKLEPDGELAMMVRVIRGKLHLRSKDFEEALKDLQLAFQSASLLGDKAALDIEIKQLEALLQPTYYELLSIRPKASDAEIKKAYLARALEMHPDKGGSHQAFVDLRTAFDTLSDALKKSSYDSKLTYKRTNYREHPEFMKVFKEDRVFLN